MHHRSLALLAQRLGLRVKVWPSQSPWQPLQRLQSQRGSRWYSSGTLGDHQAEVDAINDKFVEARDEIEYATEDAETTYFNESAEGAKRIVGEVLDAYQKLCGRLRKEERGKLQQSMGLKMEQLKAELEQLDHLHAD